MTSERGTAAQYPMKPYQRQRLQQSGTAKAASRQSRPKVRSRKATAGGKAAMQNSATNRREAVSSGITSDPR